MRNGSIEYRSDFRISHKRSPTISSLREADGERMKETVNCEAERFHLAWIFNIESCRDFASRYSLSKLSRRSTSSSIIIRERNFFFSSFWKANMFIPPSPLLLLIYLFITLRLLILLVILLYIIHYTLIPYEKSISLISFLLPLLKFFSLLQHIDDKSNFFAGLFIIYDDLFPQKGKLI